LQDDTSHAKPESLGYLRLSMQLAERKARDDILSNWYITDTGEIMTYMSVLLCFCTGVRDSVR